MKKILVLFFAGFSAIAQVEIQGTIIGKGKAYPDRISLRWNINNYMLFRQMITDGVHIDRMTLDKDSKVIGNGWVRITTAPVKALSLNELKGAEYARDTATAVVAEGLYGKTKYPDNIGLIDQIKYQDLDRQNRHLMVSLYSSMSPKSAKAAGVGFDDLLKPEPSYGYVYRISSALPSGLTGKIEQGFVYVSGHDVHHIPLHTGLKAEGGEGFILVSWPVNESPFTGYYVERSTDRKNFKMLTESIYLPNTSEISTIDADSTADNRYSYYDSVANYIPYYYRITGLNAFGEKVMFADTVMGMAKDLTPPDAPHFEMDKQGKKVTFKWTKPAAKDLKGYFLLKGKTVSADTEAAAPDMLPPTALSYQITLADNFSSSYYRLMAADTAGNVSFSYPVYVFEPDLIPPAPPSGLRGYIDTVGLVHVSWALDTTEEALRGYKVYTANQADHEFIPVSEIVADTSYTFSTTLETLTKNLYLRVVAIDGNFNHSGYSRTLALKRPDKIPPVAPQILNYTNTDKGIEIFWSSDGSADLLHNILYRRSSAEEQWTELFKSANQFNFLDKDVKPSAAYEYTLRAADSSGLYSEYAHPLYLKTSNVSAGKDFIFSGTQSDGLVKLVWTPGKGAVQYYILYKDQGQGLTLYKSIPKSEVSFEENNSAPPQGKYALKIKYEDNSESDLVICQ